MNWFYFCLLTILFYGIHDVILKHLSSNASPIMSSIIINVFASLGIFLILILDMFINKSKVILKVESSNLIWLIIGGVSLGAATITFMKAFFSGGHFSVVLPLVYVGIIMFSVVIGYFFFKEALTTKQIIGVTLSAIGMVLLIQK